MEATKTRKTTIEAFSAGKSKSGSSRRESLSEASQRKHQQKGRLAGRQILLTRGSQQTKMAATKLHLNRGGRYQHSNQRGGRYGKIEQKSPPQDCLGGCTSSGGRPQASTSHGKTIILQKGFTKPSLGMRLKHFHKNWELIIRDPDILALIKGFKYSFRVNLFKIMCREFPK